MTRQEKISKAAYSQYCNSESICFTLMCDSFKQGAKWADEHPKSPWISVKDDLPCNHEELIVKDSKGRPETKKVIIRYLRKGPSGKMVPKIMDCMMSTFAAGEGSDKFVWHFFCKEYIITHWMPIPELGIKEE